MPFVARRIVTGLTRPVFVCSPPGDTKRLFIVEQGGTIRILDLTANPQALLPTPFLTVPGLSTGNEQGLLGLAFHPKFATIRTFFVNFTDATGGTVVASYSVKPATPDVANAASAKVVLKVQQPFANHNGGWLGFGPDGFLYVGLGDGGSGNDPGNRAQNLGELLGKLLRINVDGDDFPADPDRNYAIPPTNPFVGTAMAKKEIWSFGLRNPWRCSFDRTTGELYIADVGQDKFEEVNVQPANQGGQNYGWRLREGRHNTGLGPIGGVTLTDPVHEYDHSKGVAVIGGYVYRGTKVPEMVGKYLFADTTGPVWTLKVSGGVATPATDITTKLFPTAPRPTAITSFGEDSNGEVYLLNRAPGAVYRIEPTAGPVLPAVIAGTAEGVAVTPRVAPVQTVTWGRPAPLRRGKGKPPKSMLEIDVATADVMEPSAPGTPVEEARALLQVAATIEQALLLQYLYALYSLDKLPRGSELAEPLKNIAIEEMGHLISVQNLLLAIGGTPYFARESPLPKNDPFAFRLQPVSATSFAKYVTAESPLRSQLTKYPDLLARAERAYVLAELAVSLGDTAPSPGINHVGVLYAKLYWLFQSSDSPEGPWVPAPGPFASGHICDADFVFSEAAKTQVSSDEVGHSSEGKGSAYVAPVTSRAEALAALNQIAAQGEGWTPDDGKDSHFERFLKAFEDFARYSDSGEEPALPVPTNPTTGDDSPDAERNRITHPSSRLWAELCDVRYQMLVGELWLAVSLPRSGPEADLRAQLFFRSVYTEMKMGVAQVARKLATLPRGTGDRARVRSAGAPFRMVPFDGLPTDAAGWKYYLRERFAKTVTLRTRLQSVENTIPLTPEDVSLLEALARSDAELAESLGA